jgi:hypothetical protein
MMVRFSPPEAFCATALVASKPVTAQSAQAANPRRVNMPSSHIVSRSFDPTREACQAEWIFTRYAFVSVQIGSLA